MADRMEDCATCKKRVAVTGHGRCVLCGTIIADVLPDSQFEGSQKEWLKTAGLIVGILCITAGIVSVFVLKDMCIGSWLVIGGIGAITGRRIRWRR